VHECVRVCKSLCACVTVRMRQRVGINMGNGIGIGTGNTCACIYCSMSAYASSYARKQRHCCMSTGMASYHTHTRVRRAACNGFEGKRARLIPLEATGKSIQDLEATRKSKDHTP